MSVLTIFLYKELCSLDQNSCIIHLGPIPLTHHAKLLLRHHIFTAGTVQHVYFLSMMMS